MSHSPDEFNRSVDFGRTAADYAQHRAGFPPEFFDRLKRFGVLRPHRRILDLGTGTGTVARGLAERGVRAIGMDPALPLMHAAGALDQQAGVDVAYVAARAEGLPFADRSLDAVVAGQCWHWFDRPRALTETHRVLVAQGRLVIGYLDWLPLAGTVVKSTEHLIESHNPAWHFGGGTGIHDEWLADLPAHRFTAIETFSFDLDVPYTHEAWRGRIRASAGVAATLGQAEVERFDRELAALLSERFADEPLAVPHRVFAIIARRAE